MSDRVRAVKEELGFRSQDQVEAEAGLLDSFEDYLLARGRSSFTVENYGRAAKKFLATVKEGEDPFTKRCVDRHLAAMNRAGMSGVHRRWTYYAMNAFFKAHEREWPYVKGDAPKAKENEDVPVLDEPLMIRMEEYARKQSLKRGPKGYNGKRNFSLIRLERCVGLRRIEIQMLNMDDFTPGSGSRPSYLRVATAKGGKTVMRVIDPETANALAEWISVLRRHSSRKDKEAIFIRGLRGNRLSLRGLNHIFQGIREKAGIDMPGAGFHAMRRGRVTGLHEGGMSGPEITKEFGWESDETVNRYIRLSKRRVEEKVMTVHPMFKENGKFDKTEAVAEEVAEVEE